MNYQYWCESPSNWLFSAPSDECTINEVRDENDENDSNLAKLALEQNEQHLSKRTVNPMVEVNLQNDDDSEDDASCVSQKWNDGRYSSL